MEPNYAGLFYPDVLENGAFPEDYLDVRHRCAGRCAECGYCAQVYRRIVRTIPGIYLSENHSEEEPESC